jgi:hypothetical protein
MYKRNLRPDELLHYGVLGMHWGIRRYQPYPKDYKGPGQEVGEARRIQDSIREDIYPRNAKKTMQNLLKNSNVDKASKKLIPIARKFREASQDMTNAKQDLDEAKDELESYREKHQKIIDDDIIDTTSMNDKKYAALYERVTKAEAVFNEKDKIANKLGGSYNSELRKLVGKLLGNLGDVNIKDESKQNAKVEDVVEAAIRELSKR